MIKRGRSKTSWIFLITTLLAFIAAAWHFSFTADHAAGAEGSGIPILMYHKINPDPETGNLGLRVPPEVFDRQMQYLYSQGYHTVSLGDVREYMTGERILPPKSVVITFDDGYRDNYTFALPILEKYNFKATFFVVTGTVGKVNSFDNSIQPVNQMAGWSELRDMAARGMEIGSHTVSHPRLTELSPEKALYQIKKSKLALEKGLGQPVRFFSYPHGCYNAAVEKIVEESGYEAATSTLPGLDYPDNDVYALKRICVTGQTSCLKLLKELNRAKRKEIQILKTIEPT
ncbi:MAG: polysaccharide deacetylase family protein [Eubacteriales bacterium]